MDVRVRGYVWVPAGHMMVIVFVWEGRPVLLRVDARVHGWVYVFVDVCVDEYRVVVEHFYVVCRAVLAVDILDRSAQLPPCLKHHYPGV